MARPNTTLWEIEAHTKAKHEILQRYLGAWFPILGSKIPRIMYIDGFCGPGRYLGGEDGSPIIALKEAMKQPVLANSEVIFLFIDERKDRIDHLKSELTSLKTPNNFHVYPLVNEFESTMTDTLNDLHAKGHRLAPTFAFIDPFGFKGAPFSLVERLLSNPTTEVFVNIMIDSINRFAEHPSAIDRQHIKSLLGATDAEMNQVVISKDRILAFRELYQQHLGQHARFVRYFEMRNEQDRVIYYLFFASNHPLGHAKMKEAFWKVDAQSGFSFSDQTNPDQLVLLTLDPSAALAELLKSHFLGTTQTTDSIFIYVNDKTAYISSHAKKALQRLENRNEITIEGVKSDGKIRKKGTFPCGVRVCF